MCEKMERFMAEKAKEANINRAKIMLIDGLSVEQVAKYNDLTIRKVNNIKKELQLG